MAETRELALIINAKDNASKQLKGLTSKLLDWKTITITAITAIGTAMIKAGADLEKAQSIIVKSSGSSGEALDSLVSVARNVGRRVPQDLSEVAEVVSEINTRLDLTGKELDNTSREILNFARVSGGKPVESAKTISRLISALGMDAGEASLLLDKLTKASQMSGIVPENLAKYITEAGPAFEQMGFDLDRSIGLFSQFEKVGARPEEIVSSLGKALSTMANEGMTNATEAFSHYLEKIKEAPDILSATLVANELFGSRTGGKIAEDIREGRFEVDEWVVALQDAQGTLESTAEASMTAGEKFKIIRSNIMDILTPTKEMGSLFSSAMDTITKWSIKTAESVNEAGGLFTYLGEKLKMVSDYINEKTGFIDVLKETWERLSNLFQEKLFPRLNELWEKLKPLKPFVETFAKVIGVMLYGAILAVVKIIETQLTIGIAVVTKTIDIAIMALDLFKAGWDGIVNVISKVITWIDKAISKIKELNILGGVGNVLTGGLFGGGKASGGFVSKGTTYLVGEKGPELFTPTTSGNIIPNHKLGGGGLALNITINGDVSGQELVEKVSESIMANLRFNTQLAM